MKTKEEIKKGCGKKFGRYIGMGLAIPLVCGVDNFCEECWEKYDSENEFESFDDFKFQEEEHGKTDKM